MHHVAFAGRRLRQHLAAAAALVSLALAAVSALAHAHLDRAEPAAGSTVPTAPQEVMLWFTQAIEPAFSTVEVRDAAGARVDDGKASLEDGKLLRAAVKGLDPGTYTVKWRVLSVDTHKSEGSFTFQVK